MARNRYFDGVGTLLYALLELEDHERQANNGGRASPQLNGCTPT
jgi:hypothetical protein